MTRVVVMLRERRDHALAEAHRLRMSAAESEARAEHARRNAAEYDEAVAELNDAIRTLGGEL